MIQNVLDKNKKAYLVIDDDLLVKILQFMLSSDGWLVDWVDDPRQIKEDITNYNLIIIGNHKGLTTKAKLAEVFLEKINSNNLESSFFRPVIVVLKEETDIIPNTKDILTIAYPSFHKEIFTAISNINNKFKTLEKISFDNFKEVRLGEFLNSIRSNQKISFLVGNRQLKILIVGSEINFIHSDFENFYDIFNYPTLYVAQDIIEISDLSNISNERTPRISLKNFVWEGIKNIDNKEHLMSLLPKDRNIVTVKAPLYAVKSSLLPGSNLDINWLMNNSNISVDKILRRYGYDIRVLQNLVVMYMLRIIDLSSDQDLTNKFDVKIKKGVLHKILDKIRGL
ncbi:MULTISPECIES: hypothetical protein [Desulfurella]|uniref:Uncharacterized protein n=1 Tax=Desulfurella multipotens TaxID=79269 RepID=A0A1G6LMD1_9BACT|nr:MULTISPECIES: hypothetical protein [Desulfurella]PMP63135.1 MAG: hypothetical protein C0192_08045 [Desulfurella multipotens]PMP93083.1 MAG: hypothetical protein C0173_01325 [Desulfurella sp.]SDC44371.1 hypothetical protein SAMN05660835_00852 [Desulfurella multipotens]HEX13981.1 hypothetical protein [Desulfurella acetivorans]